MKGLRNICFLLTVVSLAFLSGCSEPLVPEQPADAPIGFVAGVSRLALTTTKTEDDIPTDLPPMAFQDTSFSVFGAYIQNGDSEDDADDFQSVFNNKKVRYVNNAWTYGEPIQYWKRLCKYWFYGVHPYREEDVRFSPSNKRVVVTYSMHADTSALMVTSCKRDQTAGFSADPVSLQFHHACAAVRFLFRKGSDAGSNNYWMHSFELQNLQTVGSLIYKHVEEGETEEPFSWVLSDFQSASVFEWEEDEQTGHVAVTSRYTEFVDKARWLYVIPQTISGVTGSRPAVNFSVWVNNTDTGEPVYTTLELPDITWLPGKAYNYLIQIQPSTATVTVVTTDWDVYSAALDDIIFH